MKRDWSITRVRTDSGHEGIGRGGSDEVIHRVLAPGLIGEDPRERRRLWECMREADERDIGKGRARMSSIGGVDVALWDLYGKVTGEPVCRLLGGHRREVEVYADGIGYVAQPPEVVAKLVGKHADLGYRAVKFHLREPDPDEALEKVRLSRAALGRDRRLMVDVHRLWDGATAERMTAAFREHEVYWIEEPVAPDDLAGMRKVREAGGAMVAGAESEYALDVAERMIVEGGLQVLQCDILGAGGFTGWLRLAALAEAHGVYVAPHGASYPELVTHLVAAVPNGLMSPACPHTEPYQIWAGLYDPPFVVDGGAVRLTDRPGLGLSFDEGFIDAHAVRRDETA